MSQINVNPTDTTSENVGAKTVASNNLTWAIGLVLVIAVLVIAVLVIAVLVIAVLVIAVLYVAHGLHLG